MHPDSYESRGTVPDTGVVASAAATQFDDLNSIISKYDRSADLGVTSQHKNVSGCFQFTRQDEKVVSLLEKLFKHVEKKECSCQPRSAYFNTFSQKGGAESYPKLATRGIPPKERVFRKQIYRRPQTSYLSSYTAVSEYQVPFGRSQHESSRLLILSSQHTPNLGSARYAQLQASLSGASLRIQCTKTSFEIYKTSSVMPLNQLIHT